MLFTFYLKTFVIVFILLNNHFTTIDVDHSHSHVSSVWGVGFMSLLNAVNGHNNIEGWW